MTVDTRVEPMVREALTAVVREEPDRLVRALRAFPDDAAFRAGLTLAGEVVVTALREAYGRPASVAEWSAAAAEAAAVETWTNVAADEVAAVMAALHRGTPLAEALPAHRIGPVLLVTAGNVLASCGRDDEEWDEHLDRIESLIDAAGARG